MRMLKGAEGRLTYGAPEVYGIPNDSCCLSKSQGEVPWCHADGRRRLGAAQASPTSALPPDERQRHLAIVHDALLLLWQNRLLSVPLLRVLDAFLRSELGAEVRRP